LIYYIMPRQTCKAK